MAMKSEAMIRYSWRTKQGSPFSRVGGALPLEGNECLNGGKEPSQHQEEKEVEEVGKQQWCRPQALRSTSRMEIADIMGGTEWGKSCHGGGGGVMTAQFGEKKSNGNVCTLLGDTEKK